MADMLNHGPSVGVAKQNCTWYFSPSSDGAYMMKANKNIARSQEIRDSYGNKPNFRILLNYGFYLDNIAHAKLLRL